MYILKHDCGLRGDFLRETIALPDEGLSEYRVQYTQAGQSKGWLSGVDAPVPFSTTSEEDVFSPPAPAPVLSSAFTPLFPVETAPPAQPLLCLGLAKEAEEAEDEVLSLLQFESWHGVPGRLGLLTAGCTRSRPEACGPRPPCSFLRPKSGRNMLSMKKLVVLWACWATCRGRMGGEGRPGDGDTLSPSLPSVVFCCSSIASFVKNSSPVLPIPLSGLFVSKI